MLALAAKMRLHYYFPRTALRLFFCWTYVSAVHLMAQYPPLEEQVGLVDRQQVQCQESTATPCPTGNVCCPSGAACYTSNGVPLCNETCPAAVPTCTVNNVLACCQVGQECSPSGCISGSSGASSSGPPAETTPTVNYSNGCSTNVPCYQGTSTWCCLPSLACDFSSPGFCLRSITSSHTSSQLSPSASLSPMPSSRATLSGGAIAGIVVGALIGSALIGALLIYLCIRWRRKSTGNGERGAENSWQKPELEDTGIVRSELQGSERPPVEMPAPLLLEPDVDDENDILVTEEHQSEIAPPGEVARIEP